MFRSPAYLYGESIFTSSHSRGGKLVGRSLHTQRLYEHVRDYYFMGDLEMKKFFDHFELNSKLDKELESSSNHYFRLTVVGKEREKMIQQSFELNDLKLDIFTKPYLMNKSPLTLRSTPSPFTSFRTKLKAGSYFQNFLDKRSAIQAGFDDCLYTFEDKITEASTSNILFIKEEKIYTPNPEDVFKGIGLELLKRSFDIVSEDIFYSKLSHYDSCYLVNSVNLLTPVKSIDENFFTNTGYELMLKRALEKVEGER